MSKAFIGFFLLLLIASCSDDLVKPIETEKGGVCITFDDTFVDEWFEISNLLKENDINATFYVTKIHTLEPDELAELQTLYAEGFEVGSHGYNHINAVEYLEDHTLTEYYKNEIEPSIKFLKVIGIQPKSFSYPYGMNSDSLDTYLLKYFSALRDVTDEQRYARTKNADEVDEIFYRKGESKIFSSLGIDKNFKIEKDELRNALKRAGDNNEIIVLYAHCPVDSDAQNYQIETGYLKNLISMIHEFKLNTYTVSEIAQE